MEKVIVSFYKTVCGQDQLKTLCLKPKFLETNGFQGLRIITLHMKQKEIERRSIMKFAIDGNDNDTRYISMYKYDEGNWSPDIFDEMETNFPYKKEFLPGSDLIICTNDEYNDLVWWWEQYCEDANNRRICDNGDDYTDYPENEPIFVLIWE